MCCKEERMGKGGRDGRRHVGISEAENAASQGRIIKQEKN
jgi:hypothetical protein